MKRLAIPGRMARRGSGQMLDGLDGPLSPGEGRSRRPRSDYGGADAAMMLVDRSARSSESLRGAGGLVSPDPGELFSPPSSPRQRQTTFGATLDFIEVRLRAHIATTLCVRRTRSSHKRRDIRTGLTQVWTDGLAEHFILPHGNVQTCLARAKISCLCCRFVAIGLHDTRAACMSTAQQCVMRLHPMPLSRVEDTAGHQT